jgi:hypothetical protein
VVINGYKVQDKVLSQNGKTYKVELNRSKKKTAYKLGDNDYYWLFLPSKTGAYIIPEAVLYSKGYLQSDKEQRHICTSCLLYPHTVRSTHKTAWMNEFLYSFENELHVENIRQLFKIRDDVSLFDIPKILFKDTFIEVIQLVKRVFQRITKEINGTVRKQKRLGPRRFYIKAFVKEMFNRVLQNVYVHDMITKVFKRVTSNYLTCKSCYQEINSRNNTRTCITCARKEKRRVSRPAYADLIVELEKSNYTQVGKRYGVSDNAIRKWLKFYEKYGA